ncbi:MAG: TRAP transporter small permease [Proteobacteria bacterium]|jgi:TRAP-type mannitol/chloroaromatic compound transport system permease small subunit|nr:TRAP transporter small permease [Pseudomonadota bacterium]
MTSGSNKGVLTQGFAAWVSGLNGVGTLWIFLIMLLMNVDILMRFLFSAPIDGVTEIVELSIAGIVFLQLGDAVRAGRLTRSDGLYNKIVASRPRLGHILGSFYALCGAVFFIAILFGAVPTLIEAYERNYYAGNEGIFTFPIWPIRLILCVSCVTVVGVFLMGVCRYLSALRAGEQINVKGTA